jgi:uncharacterized RDD family membrane protein YckC
MYCHICHVEIKPGTKYCRDCADSLGVDVFGRGRSDPHSRLRKTGTIYGTISQRAGAAFVDLLLLMGIWLLLYGLISLLDLLFDFQQIRIEVGLFVMFVTAWLYNAGFECSEMMATPGKFVMGLAVLDLRGRSIDFPSASLRNLMKIASVGILFIGLLMLVWSPRSQTLHDRIAKCVVIQRDPFPSE